MDDEYKESSGHPSNPHPAPVYHPPTVTDPYYQHQYHNQYHHHHQYHYPPAGTAPPDAGQYGPVNDGNGIQGDETETKLPPKKLPKPPKSAFVLFSEFKHEEREKSGEAICKKDAIAFVADAWRSLSESERHYWTEQERNDKLRYVQEKEQHQGPWEQPKRRAKKNPLAPKRPMSAFLKYSKTRRREVKEDNPDMSNTDISRLLGEMWRNASPEERRPYREQEEKERAVYKAEIAKWRADQARIEQERALAMPTTSSVSSATTESRLDASSDDIANQHYHHHQQHQQHSAYDAKIPHVPYEYAKRTNPLNHHDPNGSHFNEPHASSTGSQYFESTGRGDRYDYSYHYHRPDYRQEHYHHHDQYRQQQPHHSGASGDASTYSHGNPGPSEGDGGYSDYRHHYHVPPSSQHQYSRSSQDGGGQYSYTYDSGTSALLAAAASDSIDQHEDHSQKTGEKDSYHYPYSTVADSTDGANLNSVNDEQTTEDYKGGNDGNNGSEGGDDAATVQYSFSGNEEQESSSPPTDPHDPDMPPPLPPPQVELPSSSPRRGFIVSL